MSFAHYSEKIFSEHLDLFNIQWIYEPTSFPLKWGSGSIKMMFTPDFYLPELDVYVEITTMNQNLITKKQKKLKEKITTAKIFGALFFQFSLKEV